MIIEIEIPSTQPLQIVDEFLASESDVSIRDALIRSHDMLKKCLRNLNLVGGHHMIRINIALASIVGLIAYSNAYAQMKALENTFKDAGYRIYSPPRQNWGPGTVFLGSLSGNKLNVDRVVCDSLFATAKPVSAGVVLPNYTASSTKEASFGLDLLENVIGKDNSANLKAEYKSPENVSVTWGQISEQSYFASSIYESNGQVADVTPSCRSAIDDIRRRGKLNKVYVIDRALLASSLDYTFKRGNETTPHGGSGSANINLLGILKLNLGGGASIRDTSTLSITKPIYIAYARPMQLKEFLPQGAVSGNQVKVRLNAASDLIIE